jgi:hypothetical protein
MNPVQTMALSKRKHMIDEVSLFSHQRKRNFYKLSYINFMKKLKSKKEKVKNINGWRAKDSNIGSKNCNFIF